MDGKQHVNSLRRGLEALRILNMKDRLTGSELARRLKIPRTTAHRILETLAHEGYVLHDLANRCFRLSTKVRHIAFGFNRDSLIAEIARPVLQDLCRETLMPVGLTTPVGPQIVTQVATDHEAPLALERIKEGATFPLLQGASGHIFLAHCTPDIRNRLLSAAAQAGSQGDAGLRPPTDAEFDRIRRDGYAISPPREGWPEGLIAIPVHLDGNYVAGIHLRFMRRVLPEASVVQLLLPKLRAAGQEIEKRLADNFAETPSLHSRINGPLLVSDSQPLPEEDDNP